MSVDHSLYLGSYIKLPNGDWDDLAEKLEIHIDEFREIPDHPGVLKSNYIVANIFADDGESQVFEFSGELKEQAEKQFLEQHAESLEKLKIHFKKDITISFGFISYYY